MILEQLFETYQQTTNPNTSYLQLINLNVIQSIIIHSFLYIYSLYIICYIYNIKIETNNLVIPLISIMILGYIGRLSRAKSIYNVFLKDYKEKVALKKTKEVIDKAYIVWYFLG